LRFGEAICDDRDGSKPAGNSRMNDREQEPVKRYTSPLKRATWCGLVSALAVALLVLNLTPLNVHYQIVAQVVASPARLAALRGETGVTTPSRADASSSSTDGSTTSSPQLLAVRVLDDKSAVEAERRVHDGQALALVEVRSLWSHRTTTTAVREWLRSRTASEAGSLPQPAPSSEARFARWQLQTTEHYLKHLKHLQRLHAQPAAGDPAGQVAAGQMVTGEDVTVARDGSAQPAAEAVAPLSTRLVSATGVAGNFLPVLANPAEAPASNPLAAVGGYELGKFEAELQAEMARARAAITSSDLFQPSQPRGGALAVTGSPLVRPRSGKIPAIVTLGMLVLAASVGILGGWGYYRAESGGVYVPRDVARHLASEGLPLYGSLGVPTADAAGQWLQRASVQARNARGALIQGMTRISETVLMFWAVAVLLRAVLDPLWRMLLQENPLVALSRLLSGLP
jgi:hypothetical protein